MDSVEQLLTKILEQLQELRTTQDEMYEMLRELTEPKYNNED